jgi:hypothetical protein
MKHSRRKSQGFGRLMLALFIFALVAAAMRAFLFGGGGAGAVICAVVFWLAVLSLGVSLIGLILRGGGVGSRLMPLLTLGAMAGFMVRAATATEPWGTFGFVIFGLSLCGLLVAGGARLLHRQSTQKPTVSS